MTSRTWFRVPGPLALQRATLKSWEWPGLRGYTHTHTHCTLHNTIHFGEVILSGNTLKRHSPPHVHVCSFVFTWLEYHSIHIYVPLIPLWCVCVIFSHVRAQWCVSRSLFNKYSGGLLHVRSRLKSKHHCCGQRLTVTKDIAGKYMYIIHMCTRMLPRVCSWIHNGN